MPGVPEETRIESDTFSVDGKPVRQDGVRLKGRGVNIETDPADAERKIVKLPPAPDRGGHVGVGQPLKGPAPKPAPAPVTQPQGPADAPTHYICTVCGRVGVLVLVMFNDGTAARKQEMRCEHCFNDPKRGTVELIVKWGAAPEPAE